MPPHPPGSREINRESQDGVHPRGRAVLSRARPPGGRRKDDAEGGGRFLLRRRCSLHEGVPDEVSGDARGGIPGERRGGGGGGVGCHNDDDDDDGQDTRDNNNSNNYNNNDDEHSRSFELLFHQVFIPMVFSLYNPEFTYPLHKHRIPPPLHQLEVSDNNGYWRVWGHGRSRIESVTIHVNW